MKKLLIIAMCTMLLLSCVTTASAAQVPATPTVKSGSGINNTYYATGHLGAKDGYYASVSFQLFGNYRFYQSSEQYTTSDSFSGQSEGPGDAVTLTGRVYPSRPEDTPISHTVQGITGYYRN